MNTKQNATVSFEICFIMSSELDSAIIRFFEMFEDWVALEASALKVNHEANTDSSVLAANIGFWGIVDLAQQVVELHTSM